MKHSFIKFFWFFVNPIRKFYWFIVRPSTKGAKALILCDGKFLMVKLSYGHRKWTFPGGAVKRAESFKDGAIREAREETGVSIKNPVFIGGYKNNKEYKKDTVEVYFEEIEGGKLKVDPLEIEKAEWFSRETIPLNHAESVDKIFEFYDQFKSQSN